MEKWRKVNRQVMQHECKDCERLTPYKQENVQLFERNLSETINRLGYAGKIARHYHDDDDFIFKFSPEFDCDEVYDSLLNDAEKIRNAMDAKNIGIRKQDGLIEFKFADGPVFCAGFTKH